MCGARLTDARLWRNKRYRNHEVPCFGRNKKHTKGSDGNVCKNRCGLSTPEESPNRVRIIVRGNIIEYPSELTTYLLISPRQKILWNSVLSTPRHHFWQPTSKTSTSTHHWTGMNTCTLPSKSSPKHSLINTTCKPRPIMDMSTPKSKKACMGSPKLES